MATALTPEGEAILAAVSSGAALKIAALAGTGKTTMMERASEVVLRQGRSVLYLVFNAAAAREAKARMPRGVIVKTGHALAFAKVGWRFKGRISRNGWEIVRAVETQFTNAFHHTSGGKEAMRRRYVYGVMDALRAFMHSASRAVSVEHVPREYRLWCDVDAIANIAAEAWVWLSDEGSGAPISDDVYLKLFHLRGMRLKHDCVIVDEMQDSNPVLLAILQEQCDGQIIGVGDENQAIYAWRGAVDALKELPFTELPLTTTWRFGTRIAAVANAVLRSKGCQLRMVGGGPSGRVVDWGDVPTAIITRTNAGLVAEALAVLTQEIRVDGVQRSPSIAFLGGVRKVTDQVRGAYDLYDRGISRHPNFRLFGSWAELREAVESSTHVGSLRPFVTLVEKYRWDVPALCDRLEAVAVDPAKADVVLATAHGFKGGQSARVRIGADFGPFIHTETLGKIVLEHEEANLAYVALTRAQTELQLGGYLPALQESLRLGSLLVVGKTVDDRAPETGVCA